MQKFTEVSVSLWRLLVVGISTRLPAHISILILSQFMNIYAHTIFRPVESRGIHESGTQGEMVTYRYYVGRLNMFEDQYDLAEKNFDYALRHCHRSAVANKKRILNYLVPVKLLRGRLPTSKCKNVHSSY